MTLARDSSSVFLAPVKRQNDTRIAEGQALAPLGAEHEAGKKEGDDPDGGGACRDVDEVPAGGFTFGMFGHDRFGHVSPL